MIDEQGELTLSRQIVNDRETFLELLGDPGGETHVSLEATYGWEWLAEPLDEAGSDVHLARPLCTRANRGGAREDRRDRRENTTAPASAPPPPRLR